MVFTVRKTEELNTNERLIAYYKKEMHSSHVLDKWRKQNHYNTKRYRKNVSYKFPSKWRYQKMKAIISQSFKSTKKKYNTLTQLWKVV